MDRSRRDSGDDDAPEAETGDAAGVAGDAARTDAADDRTDDSARSADAPRVALFVDGPNVLRDEFEVDLDDVREAAAAFGRPAATRLYLDEHATPGLIQAAEARGFEVVVTSGDVDVRLAVDLTRFAVEGRADVVAVASRDTDFKPAVETANAYGLRTVAIAPGAFGRSDALRNAATESVTLGDDEEGPSMVGYDE
ncbi:hypothetical protein C474_00130 [Halogeometricum pallidum JCM 14848]|uniref:NYN domain-containing protein n=1 Tax=Halogeometricum pallidum JCM 14848 TaxID=1227487 RepID=M0DIL3_HALPD|nr:NYN domain-containing protein [Halogeometricum pallidum]ELZ35310.1 hypothetical protein C474_00130 [Halogeometricum pallidum JCM 14848]